MEIITKLQEKLFKSYINGHITESEFTDKLKYVKKVHNDTIQLKQAMTAELDVPIDDLCKTEVSVMGNISSMHEELLGKYNKLKLLLMVPTILWSIRT